MEVLISRLKELRKLNNYSQEDIANILGVSPVAYGYYERGRTVPALEILQKIAKHYDVSVDYLLGNTDKPKADYEDENVKILAREAQTLTPNQINLVRGLIEEIKKKQ